MYQLYVIFLKTWNEGNKRRLERKENGGSRERKRREVKEWKK